MIIATALGSLFNGMTIDYNNVAQTVNYHYGDQKELNAWIKNMTSGGVRKYPLVWYVLNTFTEFQGVYETEATLAIFQNTDSSWFNPKRKEESYTKIIDPTWQAIKVIFSENQFVEVMGNLATQYSIIDEPNYGVNPTAVDAKIDSDKADKSIATDIVDARFIRLKLRINAQCIIN